MQPQSAASANVRHSLAATGNGNRVKGRITSWKCGGFMLPRGGPGGGRYMSAGAARAELYRIVKSEEVCGWRVFQAYAHMSRPAARITHLIGEASIEGTTAYFIGATARGSYPTLKSATMGR